MSVTKNGAVMDDQTSTSTSLEKAAARTPAVITTADEYRSALLRWQEARYNILSPFTNISGLAQQHGILTSLVQINTEREAGEIYDNSGGLPFLKDGEVALAKPGLRKIAECGGVSTSTMRTDPRTIPFYWEIKAIATYRDITGAIITREATMEWDLRDGSDRLKGFKPNQITEARKHGLRNCETRAVNAVIRECGCGLKQKYTRAELAKPFVVVRVMFMPDLSDPAVRQLVTAAALGGTNAMYPQRALSAGDVIDVEVTPEQSAEPDVAKTADVDQPSASGAVRVVKVESKSGEKNGRKWTRWTIVDSAGCEHSTFSKSLADFAEKARDTKQLVEITEEADGDFRNLIEITAAGSAPTLPGIDKL